MNDTLCIIPYYDYSNEDTLVANHDRSVARLVGDGADVVTIEASLAKPRITTGNVVCISVQHTLWYKESLINYAIRHFAQQYRYVAWIDSGLLLDRGWLEKAKAKLEEVDFVQCFSHGVSLTPDNQVEYEHPCYMHEYLNDGKQGRAPGGAWITKSKTVQGIDNPLYDRNIVGGGDTLFVWGTCSAPMSLHGYTQAHADHYLQWLEKVKLRQWTSSYIDGRYYHLWHTTKKQRQQAARHAILTHFRYDPAAHIGYDEHGIITLLDSAPMALSTHLNRYFIQRSQKEFSDGGSKRFQDFSMPGRNNNSVSVCIGGRVMTK
jgi:hypothetical protein